MDAALIDPSSPGCATSPRATGAGAPDPSAPRVLVAGGGIGALATALALGRRGHEVLVLDPRPALTESGAGVLLAPRDFHLLDRLGVGDAVRDRSLTLDAFRVRDGATGELVTSVTLPGSRRGSAPPHATAHRLDVYEPLLDACWELDSVQLATDSRVIGYTQRGGTVRAALADGRTVTGHALILADRARSGADRDADRAHGAPEGRLAVYHSVVPMDSVDDRWQDGAATCWVGRDWHLSHFPLPDHRYLSLTATRLRHTGAPLRGARVGLDEVLDAFPGIGYAARNVFTLGRHWRARTLPVRQTAADAVHGRIAMVGDPAHEARRPETGSCLHRTLDDAVALGGSWDVSGGGVLRWLADYDARRGERVRQSHEGHGPGHPRGRWAEDRVLADHFLFLSTGCAG
ncbi:FAD-dependent monooxygenase [Streptomyces sp. NPDC012637]|uniref:FAD-dependent monooxygenase n=1 Tax=Streptomyces sp. NPDC012637 TaxID=3364842 RepID=UPI0036EA38AA